MSQQLDSRLGIITKNLGGERDAKFGYCQLKDEGQLHSLGDKISIGNAESRRRPRDDPPGKWQRVHILSNWETERMRVAVLGGGLQGCCIALALAERGVRVTIFERRDALLCGASANNEGKIHLGYVYAGDRGLDTARTMLRGGLAFYPFLSRILAQPDAFSISTPFQYGVHRDSQLTSALVAAHFAAVQSELDAHFGRVEMRYFGAELIPARALGKTELEAVFDPALVPAAFATPEIAINPERLCAAVRRRVHADPRIEARLSETVLDVLNQGARFRVVTSAAEIDGPYDHVVNTAWDGRLIIDAKRGIRPGRQWLHRVKFGFRFEAPEVTASTTLVLGPFGDTVSYGDGMRYLSWYPVCRRAISQDLSPPAVAISAHELMLMRQASFAGLEAIVLDLALATAAQREAARACGGVIFALGRTDIDDPGSGLHARSSIGVSSQDGYHTVDTGKFTMAPLFAQVCADCIRPV